MISFRCVIAPILAMAMLNTSQSAQAKPRPTAPAGSFLHRQADTISQLVQEVQTNPVVRDRFARHFHIPPREIAGRFSHSLQPGKLPRSGSYTVYFVAESGLIYPTRMELSSGRRIFVGRDGRLMLLSGSGNPVIPFATDAQNHVRGGFPGGAGVTTEQVIVPVVEPPNPAPTPAPAPETPVPPAPVTPVPATPGS